MKIKSMAVAVALALGAGSAMAQALPGQGLPGGDSWGSAPKVEAGAGAKAPALDELMADRVKAGEGPAAAGDVAPLRAEQIQEAAASLGARAGLASRAEELARAVRSREKVYDTMFNFEALMLDIDKDESDAKAPAFFNREKAERERRRAFLVPAVITEGGPADSYPADDELRIADHMYKIESKAYLSPVAPNWRTYMLSAYDAVQWPHASLLPKTSAEKALWDKWARQGWSEGVKQADQMFEANSARLRRDFVGMARFHKLWAQGMITRPKVARANLGVTGGGNEMRTGDSIRRITEHSSLNPDTRKWLSTEPQ